MRVFVSLLFAVFLSLSVAVPTAKPKVWLMFFMKGPGKRPAEDAKVQEMMKGHLGNMGEQAKLGKLLAAGPLNDPTTERRGITVCLGENEDQIKALFQNDPFVKAEIMTVMAMPWDVDPKTFNPKVDPNSLGSHRLVLISRGMSMRPEDETMRREHDAVIAGLKRLGMVKCGTLEGTKYRQAMIFEGERTSEIEAALKESPLTRASILQFEILPHWASKGVYLSPP